jgi:hypothetical protein
MNIGDDHDLDDTTGVIKSARIIYTRQARNRQAAARGKDGAGSGEGNVRPFLRISVAFDLPIPYIDMISGTAGPEGRSAFRYYQK